MNLHDDFEQLSDKWHEMRWGKVGGTSAGEVMKTGRTALMYKILSELSTKEDKDDRIFPNKAMQHGTKTEPFARAAYEAHTGTKVLEVGYVTNHKYKHCGYSPDGLIHFEGSFEHGMGVVEIKCPASRTHIEHTITDRVPAKYKGQVYMAFIMLPVIDWVDFVSFDDRVRGYPMHIVRVRRTDIVNKSKGITVQDELDLMAQALIDFGKDIDGNIEKFNPVF